MPGPLALSALLLAFFGTAHCAAMCGGFVAASWTPLAVARLGTRAPGLQAALPMHAGRLGSYALAGVLAGALGATPVVLTGSARIQAGLFAIAALMLALTGLRIAGIPRLALGESRLAAPWWGRARSAASRLGPVDTASKRFLLGALWGWAPCALVYSALPLALVSGSPIAGGAIMLAFGVGTLPALAGAGWLAAKAGSPLHGPMPRRVLGTAIFVLAIAGLLQALGVADTTLGAFCVNPAP